MTTAWNHDSDASRPCDIGQRMRMSRSLLYATKPAWFAKNHLQHFEFVHRVMSGQVTPSRWGAS
jgi:hypothetical protein